MNMVIDNKLLDDLSAQAKENPRLRQAMDLRYSPEDFSQRMLNALEPGTVMPIHRHHASSESVVILRGKIEWIFYDDNGNDKEDDKPKRKAIVVVVFVLCELARA